MNLELLRRRLAARRGDLSKLKVAVLMGGMSAEREIALVSGNSVAKELADGGYHTQAIEVTPENLIPPALLSLANSTDSLILTTMHGTLGEDGNYQGLFGLLNIPYVSADVRGSALAMDKIISKRLFDRFGIPTPRYWVLDRGNDVRSDIPPEIFALVAKPPRQGSSVGIRMVGNNDAGWATIAELHQFYNPLLVEERIDGRELTVGIIGHAHEAIVLPPVEISPLQGFYDYEAKYSEGGSEYACPAKLDTQITGLIQNHAETIYRELGLAPYARIDLLLKDNGQPTYLEANTLPGFTPLSLLPMAAKAAGIKFLELLELLMLCALERYEAKGQS